MDKSEKRLELSIDEVLSEENVNCAFLHLKGKPNSCGFDGIMLRNLPEWWELNSEIVKSLIKDYRFIPGVVSQRVILKPNGKKRVIASLNSLDRLLTRCIYQKLLILAESIFSDNSYAYRGIINVKPRIKLLLKRTARY